MSDGGAVARGQSGHPPANKRIDRIKWLGHRLAAMTPAEVAFRFKEQARRAVSRRWQPGFAGMVRDDATLPSLPGLAEGVASLADETELVALWRNHAAGILAGQWHALGCDWPSGITPPNWHVDPVSNSDWPRDLYCFDVEYRDGGGVRGSARHAWELNRLQFLQPMAALAALDDDDELAESVVGFVLSWMEDNPPFRGINWISGLELALRTISLLVIGSLIGDRAIRDDRRHRFMLSLATHGYWLNRFPSRHSSANNHLVAEAAALYLLGLLAPSIRPAAHWSATARETLLQEVERQFHDDGVGAEQSPTYAAFSLDLFLLCGTVGERLCDPWPDRFWQRLEAAGAFLRAISDSGGNQPRIGDDDEGCVFWLSRPHDSLVNGVLASLAAVRDVPALAPAAETAQFRQAMFGRPPPPVVPADGFHCYRSGGYSVSRFHDDGEECLLVADHGPLGFLSIAAHGHADTLAVWLHVGGRPLLIDAGTYDFAADEEAGWRGHFRGTVAHNTLSLAGEDSSVMTGPFNWSRKANATVLAVEQDADTWAVEAEHDGYVDSFGYRHRRRVERLGPALYQIVDQLVGNGGVERVEIGFLMAPGLQVASAAGGWLVSENGRRRLYMRHEGPLKGWVERGLLSSKRGWCSPSFGVLEPASRLVFAGKMWAGATARFIFTTRFD